MTLEEYNAIKVNTIADLPFTEADIFDPEGSPKFVEILKSYDFYYKTLISECDHYGIAQPYIFISSDTSKNASAGSIGTKYVIKLNVGLLNWLISKFQLGTTIMVNADLRNLFGISPNTIIKYRETGVLPYTRLGDVYLYEVKAINDILNNNKISL